MAAACPAAPPQVVGQDQVRLSSGSGHPGAPAARARVDPSERPRVNPLREVSGPNFPGGVPRRPFSATSPGDRRDPRRRPRRRARSAVPDERPVARARSAVSRLDPAHCGLLPGTPHVSRHSEYPPNRADCYKPGRFNAGRPWVPADPVPGRPVGRSPGRGSLLTTFLSRRPHRRAARAAQR